MRKETRRKEIIRLLSEVEKPISAKEIAESFEMSERDLKQVYVHLNHVAKSIRPQGKQLLMEPPRCRSCGYVFKEIRKAKLPNRCPKCKSERIEAPRFIIRRTR